MKRNLGRKLSIAAFVMIIVCSLAVGGVSFALFYNETVVLHGNEALSIAESIASILDGDQFQEIMETGEETEYYHLVKQYADEVITRTNLAYLYVLDAEYGSECVYFVEGVTAEEKDGEYVLGDTEDAAVYDDSMFDTIRTGRSSVTRIYRSGEFGKMVSAFVAVKNSAGQTVGVVGVDLFANEVTAVTRTFLLRMALIVAAICAVFAVVVNRLVGRIIGGPIQTLTQASDRIAKGDMDVAVPEDTGDEIGALANSFRSMVESTRKQVAVLEAVSQGDLTVRIESRGEQDTMSASIRSTVERLNDMFAKILQDSGQVAMGAQQIAVGAQQLATGSTEQAASVEQLSAAITEISNKTRSNADMAVEAAQLAQGIQAQAEAGTSQMTRMNQAVHEINQASQAINKVIKVIEDIAFQTNILALNAAVEAARAGQHGKGFAVVADEVRNLAQKSAEAAKETGMLIADTIDKAKLGAQISDDTAGTIAEIIAGINQSYALVNRIAVSTQEQSTAIVQVNQGIDQVASVIQQNSATSEQSAASSQQMSEQAQHLQQLVASFRILEEGAPSAPPFGEQPMEQKMAM